MICMQIRCNLEHLDKKSFFEIFTFFYPFLPILDKIKYFGQNKSSRAQILASILFLNGESEKIGPMEICWPFRLQVGRYKLTISMSIFNLQIKREVLNEHGLWKYSYSALLETMPHYRRLAWRKFKNILLFALWTPPCAPQLLSSMGQK